MSCRRGWSQALMLGVLAGLSGCGDAPENSSDEDEPAVVTRPPVIIDEPTMIRLLAAMRELQDFSRGHPLVRQVGDETSGKLPIDTGATAILGEGSLPILKKHGFESALQFDSIMAHTQRAVQKIKLGEHGGFDNERQEYKTRMLLSEAREQLKQLETERGLSENQRRQLLAMKRQEIESLERQLVEMQELADVLKGNYDQIPAVNLETVRRHLTELDALMNP